MNILKRPMFFAAGVCCIVSVISLFNIFSAILLLTISLVGIGIVVIRKNYKYITVMALILLFAVSLTHQLDIIKSTEKYDNKVVSGDFLVISQPVAYDDFNTVTLKSSGNGVLPKNIKVFAFDYDKSNLNPGDIITANLKLSAIDKYDEYRFYDYGNEVYFKASIKKLTHTNNYNRFYKTASDIRTYVKDAVSSHFSDDAAGFLLALTIGDKTLLSDDFLANIKTTGISHIVVVSGMHLSIIMAAIMFLQDKLFYNKYICCLVSVLSIILICAVCGFTMSVIRSGVMFIFASLAPVFNRENDSLSSLSAAFTVVLIGAPFSIFNISFQLSVLSTLSIVWIVPWYYQKTVDKFSVTSKFIKTILGMASISIFAVIFTLPVIVKTFGYVSLVGIFTNLLVTYPVMFALVLNILSLVLNAIPFISFISDIIFCITGLFAKFIVFTVNTTSKLPITVAVLPKTAVWWSIVLILVVIAFMYVYELKKEKV